MQYGLLTTLAVTKLCETIIQKVERVEHVYQKVRKNLERITRNGESDGSHVFL